MKTLTVSVLVYTLVALSEAAVLPPGSIHVVKRHTYCPGGWVGYNRRCFRYIPTSMTWSRAEKNCQSMGANLASVHSAEEYHEIQKMIVTATHAYGATWIGGSDAQEEGIWLWIDGSGFNYRHCGGFNNDKRKQHCLQMNYGADNCWDDVECTIKLPFVCAKNP